MNTQIDAQATVLVAALKQACRAFYEREHRQGITTDELIAYKACKAAVKDATGEYYASGEWHTSQWDAAWINHNEANK